MKEGRKDYIKEGRRGTIVIIRSIDPSFCTIPFIMYHTHDHTIKEGRTEGKE